MNIFESIWKWISGLFGGGGGGSNWKKACSKIESAMITPLFAYKDAKQAEKQAKDLEKSPNYNAVCALLDQQDGYGRGNFGEPNCYIVKTRTKTKLTKEGTRNLEAALNAGITPVVVTHNDYAAEKLKGSYQPSQEGQPPANLDDFYNAASLENEKAFLKSLSKYFEYIHIQLTIECTNAKAIPFNLELAKHLRSIGFNNKILMNPLGSAYTAYGKASAEFGALGVLLAQSYHGDSPPPFPVWNTDGNKNPNQINAKGWIAKFRASGKDFIFHTQELKNCPTGIPAGYL